MKRALAVIVLASGLAQADTIHLKGGRKLEGVVVERTDTMLVIETGPGRVGIPLARIERIVESRSALATYRERAQQLGAGDAAGWLELAAWAQGANLETQAHEACERALRIDPANATAQRCLGRVLHEGQWMTFEDSQRARGLIAYGSQWLSPAEYERLTAQESAEALARRLEQEADARVREAEARVREAEARARAAEHEADSVSAGVVYVPPFGGVACSGDCGAGCGRACDTPAPRPAPSVRPAEPPARTRRSGMTGAPARPRTESADQRRD